MPIKTDIRYAIENAIKGITKAQMVTTLKTTDNERDLALCDLPKFLCENH